MRRPIFADTDRVVGEDVNGRNLHNRAQPDRSAGVIREDQEARAVRPNLRKREAIEYGGHEMFADAEMKISSGGRFSKEVTGAVKGQSSFRRRRQIGCASDYPRHVFSYRVQNLGRRVTTCEPLCVRLKRRNVFVPTVRQFSFLHSYEMVR